MLDRINQFLYTTKLYKLFRQFSSFTLRTIVNLANAYDNANYLWRKTNFSDAHWFIFSLKESGNECTQMMYKSRVNKNNRK